MSECKMLYRIHFDRKPVIGSLVEELVIMRQKEIDEHIVDELYKVYKDTAISEVYIIGEKEFEAYLKATLPKYLEMKRGE